MKLYRVRREYIDLWTQECVDDLIVGDIEIDDLSIGWSIPVSKLKEQLDEVCSLENLRDLDIFPRRDVLIANGSLSINIFWHEPSFNLGFYPIVQVDYGDKTIFHHEGSENPAAWWMVLDRAAKKIKSVCGC